MAPPRGDKEVMALHDKYGRDMCDGLADSLKKDSRSFLEAESSTSQVAR